MLIKQYNAKDVDVVMLIKQYNVKDVDVLMPMINLVEYRVIISKHLEVYDNTLKT